MEEYKAKKQKMTAKKREKLNKQTHTCATCAVQKFSSPYPPSGQARAVNS